MFALFAPGYGTHFCTRTSVWCGIRIKIILTSYYWHWLSIKLFSIGWSSFNSLHELIFSCAHAVITQVLSVRQCYSMSFVCNRNCENIINFVDTSFAWKSYNNRLQFPVALPPDSIIALSSNWWGCHRARTETQLMRRTSSSSAASDLGDTTFAWKSHRSHCLPGLLIL